MEIILVRHLESLKNLTNSFSAPNDMEPLTRSGLMYGHSLASGIASFANARQHLVKAVYSASSKRSISTADIIARELSVPVIDYNSFRSIRSAFAGIPESQLPPTFLERLILYRKGLLNSYDLKFPDGSEEAVDFEKRVVSCMQDILGIPNESLKIIVLHRSSLTALLLHFAREYYSYPRYFYGYVELNPGYVSWLRKTKRHGWRIEAVNVEAEQLYGES